LIKTFLNNAFFFFSIKKVTCFYYLESLNNFKFQGDYLMTAAYLPSILVPLVGLVFPAIAMTSIFMYIEKQEIN
jgi:photosystem I subunit VIII